VMLVDRTDSERSTEWFNAIEESHDVILYQADYEPSEWTHLCVRQADRILLLADASRTPDVPPPALSVMPSAVRGEQVEVVFLHRSQSMNGHAAEIGAMLTRFGAGFHYHVRTSRVADIARLARLISGRAVGLVFSGGGARGFAHIGVMKAFK